MKPGNAAVDAMVRFDDDTLDHGVVDGTGRGAWAMAGTFRRLQSGYVRSYALSVLLGALIVDLRTPGGELGMSDFAWLTVGMLVPLVGAVSLMAMPEEGGVGGPPRLAAPDGRARRVGAHPRCIGVSGGAGLRQAMRRGYRRSETQDEDRGVRCLLRPRASTARPAR